MTIKGMRGAGAVAGLVLLAAAAGGVAGSALESASAAQVNQHTAVYAAPAPPDNSCSMQSNIPGCPGPANTNWG